MLRWCLTPYKQGRVVLQLCTKWKQQKHEKKKKRNMGTTQKSSVINDFHPTKANVQQWVCWSGCGSMTQSVFWICDWKRTQRISTKLPSKAGGCWWRIPSGSPRRCRLHIRCSIIQHTQDSSMHRRLRIRRPVGHEIFSIKCSSAPRMRH